jgi:hypothetical protein
MAKIARKMSYEEFAEHLPEVLDELARDEDTLLVEKNGHIFRVSVTEPGLDSRLPPLPPLEVRLEALRRSAGALKGVDIEQLKADLRIMRQQDSSGRPG